MRGHISQLKAARYDNDMIIIIKIFNSTNEELEMVI